MSEREYCAITSSDLYLARKNNVGFNELLSKHNMSGEELEKKVWTFFKKDARNVLRELHKNDKKSRKEPVAPATLAEPSSTGEKVIPLVRNFVPRETSVSKDDELEKLRERAEKLDKKLRDLDSQRGILVTEHANNCKKLQEVLLEIREIRFMLDKHVKQFMELVERDNEGVIKKYNQLASQASLYREEHQEVLARIRELDTVKVHMTQKTAVVSGGDGEKFKPNEDGADNFFAVLSQDGLFDEFKVSDVRIIARAWAIYSNAPDYSLEFTFENEDLLTAFELLMENRGIFTTKITTTVFFKVDQ